jgi:hypothetical protein
LVIDEGEFMSVRNAIDVEKICSRIYSECDSLVTWNWDDRYQAVLSEFPADQEEEVMSVLEKYFDACWDEETIDYAPGKIRSVAKDLGNIRHGQRLFSSDPDQEALLLGAFWPWKNGEKIYLRMLVDLAAIDMGMEAPESEGIQSPFYS